MRKYLIYILVVLFWSSASYSKDLFEYLKSDQPPPLILGHTDFDKALNREISDLSIYLGMSKNKKPINETSFTTGLVVLKALNSVFTSKPRLN